MELECAPGTRRKKSSSVSFKKMLARRLSATPRKISASNHRLLRDVRLIHRTSKGRYAQKYEAHCDGNGQRLHSTAVTENFFSTIQSFRSERARLQSEQRFWRPVPAVSEGLSQSLTRASSISIRSASCVGLSQRIRLMRGKRIASPDL